MTPHRVRQSMLVTVAVALTAVPVAQAGAAPVPCVGTKVIALRDTLLNVKPDGPFLGTLRQGRQFLVIRTSPSGKYTYGYAYGKVKARGWIDTVDLGPKRCATPTFTG